MCQCAGETLRVGHVGRDGDTWPLDGQSGREAPCREGQLFLELLLLLCRPFLAVLGFPRQSKHHVICYRAKKTCTVDCRYYRNILGIAGIRGYNNLHSLSYYVIYTRTSRSLEISGSKYFCKKTGTIITIYRMFTFFFFLNSNQTLFVCWNFKEIRRWLYLQLTVHCFNHVH